MSWRGPTGSIRREKWYTPQPQRFAEYGGAKGVGVTDLEDCRAGILASRYSNMAQRI
jgi:hypothetical protein